MKAAIYCRKSEDAEDRQLLSISGQEEENTLMAKRNGDTVIRTYSDSGTAKEPHRRDDFKQMIASIKQGKIEVLYCWKLNRLARNPIEGGEIQWLLQKEQLKAIITPHKTYLPSDNVLQMAVELGMATQYSIDLSRDVKRGMNQKTKAGWRPGKATVGYINDYAGLKGEKEIFIDEERFHIVRKCWDYLLTGAYTVSQIHRLAIKEWNLTTKAGRGGRDSKLIGLSTLERVFTNPFYYGEYDWNSEVCIGKHKPMITQQEFEKAQAILGKRGKPRERKYLNPYAGLIQCGECGAMIVVNVIQKKIKATGEFKTYRYYRCGHNRKIVTCKQNKALAESKIESGLADVVDAVEIPQSLVEWCLEQLQHTQSDRIKQNETILTSHQKGYKDVIQKIDTLVDRQLLDATKLPEEMFNEKFKQLRTEKERLKKLTNDFDASTDTETNDIITSLNFALRLRERFANGSKAKRLEILHQMGQVIQLTNGVLDFQLSETFSSIRKCNQATYARLPNTQLLKSLQKPLSEVESSTLDQVISIWSG